MSDSHPSSALVAQLADIVSQLQVDPPDVDQGLTELILNATQFVPGVEYAGITLASRSRGISTPAATHSYPALLDEIQQRHQEGPCLSAAWEHHTMRIDDLAADPRWPRFAADAVARTPIRSILSFALSMGPDDLRALNFYAETPGVFDGESVESGLIFATHVALAWKMLRRDEQFRSALATRDIIGQAKGIVMERFNLDAVKAFNLLSRLSQQTNIRVADVAQRLVDADHPSPAKTDAQQAAQRAAQARKWSEDAREQASEMLGRSADRHEQAAVSHDDAVKGGEGGAAVHRRAAREHRGAARRDRSDAARTRDSSTRESDE